MRQTVATLVILSLLLVTVGCGSIINGTTQQVGISSNPSSARVSVNGELRGSTPVVLDLRRKNTHFLKLELDGYEPYETTLTRSTSGWLWGNIVVGGLIGLVIDASTGGMYKLTPQQVSAELRQRSAAVVVEEGLVIAFAPTADPRWEKVGQLTLVK
jgi:hypothetical protein